MTLLGTGVLALVLQTSLVQGVVLRKGTTERLSKATVELHRDPGSAGILDSVTTEDDGRFSFSNVEPGNYRLIVTRRGYARCHGRFRDRRYLRRCGLGRKAATALACRRHSRNLRLRPSRPCYPLRVWSTRFTR